MEVLTLLTECENWTYILNQVYKYTLTYSRNVVQPKKNGETITLQEATKVKWLLLIDRFKVCDLPIMCNNIRLNIR